MNLTKLSDQELAELYHPWVAEFFKTHGREPTGIDSRRHHSDYMMAKGNQADIDDLQVFARLLHRAADEQIADAPPGMQAGSCSALIANMLSTIRSIQTQSEKSASA